MKMVNNTKEQDFGLYRLESSIKHKNLHCMLYIDEYGQYLLDLSVGLQ